MDVIHGFLTRAYWSEGIPCETVEKAINGSFCVGCYAEDGHQVGFAHGVYAKLGFEKSANPDIFMEITDPDIYRG